VFEWDEAKREANLAKHGVDFVDAIAVFADPFRLERSDERHDYGEERRQTIGAVGTRVLFIVYTRRNCVRRLISARKASKDEREAYLAGRGRP
jgi:hypothetical protein